MTPMSPEPAGRAFYAGLLEALARVMGSANPYLFQHGSRVAWVARHLALEMGRSARERSALVFAGVLADIGMVGLAEDAWTTPTPRLPQDVRERVRAHPMRSASTLRTIPHLEAVVPLVRHHHEWWDGSGYPDGLSGAAIPVAVQILRLADTVAALGEPRPSRPALRGRQVEAVIRSFRGLEFGPEVADAWLGAVRAGRMPPFEATTWRACLYEAAATLVPADVSPLSGGHLLDVLSSVIDAKDPYTAGHSRRVAFLAVAISNRLGLAPSVGERVWAGGFLHDLGKLVVPVRVLAKRGPLTASERAVVQAHPEVGADIVGEIEALRGLTSAIRHHHERWDGGGYPSGLAGGAIPLDACILAVADAYDAMTSARAYRNSRSHHDALAEIARCTGQHFAPSVAGAMLALPDAVFGALRPSPSDDDDLVLQRPSLLRPAAN